MKAESSARKLPPITQIVAVYNVNGVFRNEKKYTACLPTGSFIPVKLNLPLELVIHVNSWSSASRLEIPQMCYTRVLSLRVPGNASVRHPALIIKHIECKNV